jgi:hypothetical protein
MAQGQSPKPKVSVTWDHDLFQLINAEADRRGVSFARVANDLVQGSAELRQVLADILMAAMLHPADDRYEITPRYVLDKARMMIDQDDMAAPAERSRMNTKRREEIMYLIQNRAGLYWAGGHNWVRDEDQAIRFEWMLDAEPIVGLMKMIPGYSVEGDFSVVMGS